MAIPEALSFLAAAVSELVERAISITDRVVAKRKLDAIVRRQGRRISQ